jgi:hypothetical protein
MRPWTRWSLAAVTTLVGAAYLHWKGPVPVVRVFDTLPIDAPLWYMLSAFPVLGLLLADGLALLRDGRRRHAVELAVQIAVMVVLSHSRLELRIPISGHALLFAAFLLRRTWYPEPSVPWRRLEQTLGGALLTMVAGVKLLWWRDPTTFAVGLLTAALLCWAGRTVVRGQRDADPGS